MTDGPKASRRGFLKHFVIAGIVLTPIVLAIQIATGASAAADGLRNGMHTVREFVQRFREDTLPSQNLPEFETETNHVETRLLEHPTHCATYQRLNVTLGGEDMQHWHSVYPLVEAPGGDAYPQPRVGEHPGPYESEVYVGKPDSEGLFTVRFYLVSKEAANALEEWFAGERQGIPRYTLEQEFFAKGMKEIGNFECLRAPEG